MRISIEGVIGVGKTTFVDYFSSQTDFSPLYESVGNNPFLDRYYVDSKRWAYTLQTYFLYDRYVNHMTEGDIILDRSLYGDLVFANLQKKEGLMLEEEYISYNNQFRLLTERIPPLDICFMLKTTPEEAYERIKKRDRGCESSLSFSYLKELSKEIEALPSFLPTETQYVEVEWGLMAPEEIQFQIKGLIQKYL